MLVGSGGGFRGKLAGSTPGFRRDGKDLSARGVDLASSLAKEKDATGTKVSEAKRA